MSAPTPIQTQIRDAVIAAFLGIDGSAPYHHTVRTVSSDLQVLASLPAMQCPALLVVPDPQASTRGYLLGNTVVDTHAFAVEGRVDAGSTRMGERMTVSEALHLDMEYALALDPSLGGIAVDTTLTRVGLYPGVGADPQVHFVDRVLVTSVQRLGER